MFVFMDSACCRVLAPAVGVSYRLPALQIRHPRRNPFAYFGRIPSQLSAELAGAGQLAGRLEAVERRNADAQDVAQVRGVVHQWFGR